MSEADAYGFPEEGEDDYAAMLSEVEGQADARTVRLALGVGDEELDRIRMGHPPDERTAERLRLLRNVSREADLSDPGAVLAALTRDEEPAPVRAPAFGAVKRAKLVIIAFVVADLLVGAGIVAFFFLRGL